MHQNVLNPASFWLFDAGEQWLYGCWFYRPDETFHVATRKFLEKEVFKSDYYNKVPVSKILGKCMVLFVKVNRTKLSGPSSALAKVPVHCPCLHTGHYVWTQQHNLQKFTANDPLEFPLKLSLCHTWNFAHNLLDFFFSRDHPQNCWGWFCSITKELNQIHMYVCMNQSKEIKILRRSCIVVVYWWH